MSDDKKGSHDLTRIEDLSDFIHDEDEVISLKEESSDLSMLDMEKDSFGDATSFIEIPEEFGSDDNDVEVFSSNVENELKSDEVDFGENSFEGNSDFSESDLDFNNENSDFNTDSEDTPEENLDFSSETTTSFDIDETQSNEFNVGDFGDTNFPQEDNEDDSPQELEDLSDSTKLTPEIDSFESEEVVDISASSKREDVKPENIITPPITPPKDFKEPESLSDVKEFAEVITSTDLSIEGNPPFSVVLSNIKYYEDSIEILDILKEYKIIDTEHENEAKTSIERGQILIPRLSEYAAIILCHKLRRFDLNLKMGLSQEIHSSSTFEKSDKGLISRKTILSNKKMYESLQKSEIKIEDIQVSTLNSFENHLVLKNLGIQSKSKSIPNKELVSEHFDTTYSNTSKELINDLKKEAKSLNANGLLSVTISLINNPIEDLTNFICTASIVLVSEQ